MLRALQRGHKQAGGEERIELEVHEHWAGIRFTRVERAVHGPGGVLGDPHRRQPDGELRGHVHGRDGGVTEPVPVRQGRWEPHFGLERSWEPNGDSRRGSHNNLDHAGQRHGVQRVFAAVYSDGNGYADIKHVFLLVNSAVSGSGACYVHYNEDTNRLAVRSGSSWKFTSTGPGSGSPVSSAQCSLDPAVSSVTRTGDNLTVNYAVTFTDAMAGSQNLYLYAKDGGNLTSGWSDHGNLSVTAAEPASASVLSTIEIDTTGVRPQAL